MHSFRNDYSEGAHEKVLQALADTNKIQTPGYGEDAFCEKAKQLIRAEMNNQNAEVFFLTGGTQTNLTLIAAMLRPYEAVIGVDTAHINVHETGAVEATGHKVLTCTSKDGKLTPALVQQVLDEHKTPHMVKPKMVYISNATELGTIYQKAELERLSRYCHEQGLFLFMDGARLGSALTSKGNDLTLGDAARLTDCFYIGGTKNGLLFGEALVISNPEHAAGFRYMIKQKGGMLAKGRLLGIQFSVLFEEGLFYRLAEHANEAAAQLKEGIVKAGYSFLTDSPTNQLFPIFPNEVISSLEEVFAFEIQQKVDEEHTCIRLVTSWATEAAAVAAFITHLAEI